MLPITHMVVVMVVDTVWPKLPDHLGVKRLWDIKLADANLVVNLLLKADIRQRGEVK
jgi:hypothetical protein